MIKLIIFVIFIRATSGGVVPNEDNQIKPKISKDFDMISEQIEFYKNALEELTEIRRELLEFTMQGNMDKFTLGFKDDEDMEDFLEFIEEEETNSV